jgi:hypothetical protein
MNKAYAMISKGYFVKFLIFIFLIYYFYQFANQVILNVELENGYTFGDWLINYEDGGFKRRGISGSFFIWLYDVFGLKIKLTVLGFQMLLNILFVVTFYLILLKRNVSLKYLFLILSPCAFLFFIVEPGSIGRKELILFSTYSYYLYRLSFANRTIWEVFYPFLVILPLSILFHEIYFFYAPFFIVPLFTTDNLRFTLKSKLQVIVVFSFISLLTMSLLYFFGGEINQGNSFQILETRGISPNMQNLKNMGILTWNDNFDKLKYFIDNGYHKYFFSLLIGFIIFYTYSIFGNLNLSPKEFLYVFVFTFIISLPVYILAIDWGRWINIQFILTLVFFGYATKSEPRFVVSTKKYSMLFIIGSFLLSVFWRFELVDNGLKVSELLDFFSN